MNNKIKNNIKGMIICLIGFSCFSFGDATYKWVGSSYSVFLMALIASTVSLLTILTISAIKGEFLKTIKPSRPYAHLFRGTILFMQLITFIFAINHMDLAKAYTIIFIAPFITALIAIPMFKEKTTIKQWAAILIGFIGVLVVLRPGIIPIDIYTISIIISAFLFSFANLYARKITTKEDSSFTLPASVSFVTIILTLILIPTTTSQGYVMPDTQNLLLLIFAGLISSAGLYLLPKAFTIASASAVSPMHYIQLIWATIFGIFIFEEQTDPYTFIGASIIIASGIYLIRHENKS